MASSNDAEITLRVYDISRGAVAMLASTLLNMPLEGIWHSGIVVYGKEFFYGNGCVEELTPAEFEHRFQLRPHKIMTLGRTTKTMEDFRGFLAANRHRFTETTYNIISWNCNHFCNEACKFLLNGQEAPREIVHQHEIIQASPAGGMIISMLQNLNIENPVGAIPSPGDPVHTPPPSTVTSASETSNPFTDELLTYLRNDFNLAVSQGTPVPASDATRKAINALKALRTIVEDIVHHSTNPSFAKLSSNSAELAPLRKTEQDVQLSPAAEKCLLAIGYTKGQAAGPLVEYALPSPLKANVLQSLHKSLKAIQSVLRLLTGDEPSTSRRFEAQCQQLRNMGFTDMELCQKVLSEVDGSINRALDRLLQAVSTIDDWLSKPEEVVQPSSLLPLFKTFIESCQNKQKINLFDSNTKLLVPCDASTVESVAATCLRIFVQANCTGPLFNTVKPSEKALGRVSSEHESFWQSFYLGNPDDRLSDLKKLNLRDSLSIDGDEISGTTRAPLYLLFVIQVLVASLLQESKSKVDRRLLLLSRAAFVWQLCLPEGSVNPSPTLKALSLLAPLRLWCCGESEPEIESGSSSSTVDTITKKGFESLSKYLDRLQSHNKTCLILEFCHRLMFFREDKKISTLIDRAAAMAGCSLLFDSVLGLRRKQQAEPRPLLVLRVRSCDEKKPSCTSSTAVSKNLAVGLTDIDFDTDLLEGPAMTGTIENPTELEGPLPKTQHLVILALGASLLIRVQRGGADILSFEQLRAIVDRGRRGGVLSTGNPMIEFAWLNLRSKLELARASAMVGGSSLHQERALMQLQSLNEFFVKDEETGPLGFCPKRLTYSLQVPYPFRTEAVRELGKLLAKMGRVLSACELFKDLAMWEDAAECLIACNRASQALDVLTSWFGMLDESAAKTPRTLCCLGDIKNDTSYYEEAWRVSKGRYARAQRSLALHYFKRNDFEKSAAAFSKGLSLNPLSVRSLFMQGIALLRLERYDEALASFSRVVSLLGESSDGSNDRTLGEAWANMASVHTQQQRWPQASYCIKQAVRFKRNDWRLWQMATSVAVKNRDVDETMNTVRQLIALECKDQIEPWVLGFVASSALEKGAALSQRASNFFFEVENALIKELHVAYDCHASVAAALGNNQLEYELRWKQVRVTLDKLPDQKKEAVSQKVSDQLESDIEALIESHKRQDHEKQVIERQAIERILISLMERNLNFFDKLKKLLSELC